jgi:hypothetical protein
MRNLKTIILLPILLSGCYGDINIYLEPGRNISINADSSEVVFYMFSQVYRPAKGLLAFPDGGKPHVLYKNIALYQFNTKTKGLKQIFDFGSLIPYRDNWSTLACPVYDSIVFKLTPVWGWENELKYPSRGIDSTIYNNYKDWFIYYIHSEKIRRTEEIDISILPKSEFPYHKLTGIISHIPMMEWGINLDAVYPQSKRKRINELVELKGNQLYRNAIIELLADDLINKDIDRIIGDMNRYVDSKKGYSRAKLLNTRDTTIERLESIRKNKPD